MLSTDAVVHELYESPELVSLVRSRFGDDVAPRGVVDRTALARVVFATPEDRGWLEGALWPRVGARMVAWREGLESDQPPPRAGIVEVPLLFESGMEAAFDATIAIVAPEPLRTERAAGRGHEALDERAARQLSQDEKAARATHVVVNDGSMSELEQSLSAVLDMLGQ